MPDANLFRQTAAGVVFWAGVFEREPVALFITVDTPKQEDDYYTLYKVAPRGALIIFCEFIPFMFGIYAGRCKITHREMKLKIDPGAHQVFISTVEQPKPPKSSRPIYSQDIPFNPFIEQPNDEWFREFFGRHSDVNANQRTYSSHAQQNPVPPKPSSPRELDPIVDCFAFLGVSMHPTEAEIKAAYRPLIKKWHPDLCENKKLAESKTRGLTTAYDEALRRIGARK